MCSKFLFHLSHLLILVVRNKRTKAFLRNQAAIEEKKKLRRKYWLPLIAIETAAIMSIAWYLHMDLSRDHALFQSNSTKHFERSSHLLSFAVHHSVQIYNSLYRQRNHSTFVMTHSNSSHLNGKIGTIVCYDKERGKFLASFDRKAKASVTVLIEPDFMEPLNRANPNKYNALPRHEKLEVHFDCDHECWPHVTVHRSVVFRPAIHDTVTAAHPQPHLVSDLAAPMLFDQLTKVAESEESEARLQREVAESFATFAANRTGVTHLQKRKRKRVADNSASPQQLVQKSAVMDAIVCHWQNSMKTFPGPGTHAEDRTLFTFPFPVSEQFVKSVSEELVHFNALAWKGVDFELQSNSSLCITTSAVESVPPGQDLDESVIDLCLLW